MKLGRNVIDIMRDRAKIDPKYRELRLQDTVDMLLSGDTSVGLLSLHHHIYCTIGFEKLGKLMGKSPDDLVEMLLPDDADPPASAVFEMIGLLREDEGVEFEVSVVRRDAVGAVADAETAGVDEREAVAVAG